MVTTDGLPRVTPAKVNSALKAGNAQESRKFWTLFIDPRFLGPERYQILSFSTHTNY